MRKIGILLAATLAAAAIFPATALAAPPEQTKLIVAGWTADPSPAQAGEGCTLTLSIQNTHPKNKAYNLTVTIDPAADALAADGVTTRYVAELPAGETVEVSFEMDVLPGAASGVYAVGAILEYEDSRGGSWTVAGTVTARVEQPLRMQAGDPEAAAVNTGEPVTVKTAVYNLGKERICNLTATVEGERMETVDAVYVGNVDSGQAAAVEVTVRMDAAIAQELKNSDAWDSVAPGDPDPAAEYPARLILTCEDAAGTVYARSLAVTVRVLVPRPEEPGYTVSETTNTAANNPDPTGWVIAGLALCAAAAAILWAVWAARKRSAG